MTTELAVMAYRAYRPSLVNTPVLPGWTLDEDFTEPRPFDFGFDASVSARTNASCSESWP